jgi:hypothetical protein
VSPTQVGQQASNYKVDYNTSKQNSQTYFWNSPEKLTIQYVIEKGKTCQQEKRLPKLRVHKQKSQCCKWEKGENQERQTQYNKRFQESQNSIE